MYEEPIVQILNLLKDTFKDAPFKACFDGDPDVIASSNLPALCVLKNTNTNASGPTQLDRVTEEILIKVVFDKRTDWGVNTDKADLTDRRIRRVVEERDPTTKQYVPTSIKGALRTKLSLDGATLNQNMRFDLGTVVRPKDVVTREGHLIISVSYLVPVPRNS